MLVTFLNSSSTPQWVSTLQMSLLPGVSAQTRRTSAQLDMNQGDKVLIQTGAITLTFTAEPGDGAALGTGPAVSLPTYTNVTRPLASTVAIYSAIWNTDDNATNWSDGANWRDNAGNIA